MRLKDKKRSVKDRDWILKKKEVCIQCLGVCFRWSLLKFSCSCIVNEAKVYLMIQNTLAERGGSSFRSSYTSSEGRSIYTLKISIMSV
jgi:hypothetical protein